MELILLKLSLLCTVTGTVHVSFHSVAHSLHGDHKIFQTQATRYRCDDTELKGQILVLTNNCKFYLYTFSICGPGYLSHYSDWLRAGRSEDRIPVGARFSAPVHNGPLGYNLLIQCVPGPFSGGKAAGAWR
jgi:hypothetical protein